MKKLLSLSLLLCFITGLTATAQWRGIEGSGRVVKEKRNESGFKGISVGGSMHVLVKPGSSYSVEVEADDNLMEYITTEVRGNQLVIGTRPNRNIRPSKGINVYVVMPTLSSAKIGGSGSIKTDGLMRSQGEFEAGISGSGNLKLQIEAENTIAAISGSGHIEIAGKTGKLNVTISGSGSFKGYDYPTRESVVRISGSGNAQTHVSESLDAVIAGSGNVLYKGMGAVSVKATGSGRVRKVE